jgi:probable O-glycosylation ligase (exosortase A-associated)
MSTQRNPLLSPTNRNRLAFFLILFYVFLEYGRPQALLRPLAILHLSALTSVMLAALLLARGKVRLQDRPTLLFVLLLSLMVVHGPIAVNNYWALMTFIAMCYNFIAYLSLVHFVDDEERFGKLVDVWIKVHVMVAVVGIILEGRGAGGFLGDENDLCMTLNMVLPFGFFLAMSAQKNTKKIYYIALTCIFLFVIILTKSRGGFIGLAATGVYCWWKSKRKILSGAVVAVLVLFMALAAPSNYWDEIRTINDENAAERPYGTGSERYYSWNIAWEMFLDHPIMGVGQGNFPWNANIIEQKLGLSFHQRSFAGRAAHSMYFTLMPELGLVGIVLFGYMLLLTVRNLRFIQRSGAIEGTVANDALPVASLAMALEASLVGYLASGVFISVLYYPNFYLLMGFTLSLRKIVERRQDIAGGPGLPGGGKGKFAISGGRSV